MKINPQVAASAISRYAQVTGRQAPASAAAPGDRLEISDRAQLYASLLKAARQGEDGLDARVHAIVNRLASETRVDLDRLAGRMLGSAAGEQADLPED